MELLSLFVMAGVLSSGLSARILVLVPMPAKSHALLLDRIVVELANRGHQVTYVTHFPLKNKPPNLKEIALKGGKDLLKGSLEMDIFELRHMTPLQNTIFLPLMGVGLCDALLQTQEFKDLMKEKFDAILGEAFTDESILAGFAYKSQAPIIGLATFMPNIWVNYMVGNPAPSAYIPDPFLGYGTKMSLLQRINNFLIGVIAEASHTLFYLPKQDEIMRKHFGNHLPPVHDIIKNTSLVLVNHHHSLAFPRSYNPNMMEIGGIHIDPPKKLPQDLQKFMDEATEGVVLFSLGSNLQSSLMPKEKIQLFLSAFGRLKQKVLWKFEADLPRAPKNVKISNWLPQNDLLAHPNLKVFFTHGGLLSTTESIYRGVPIVGIPIFGDQPVNMRQTVNSGFGLSLDFDSVTEDQIVNAINEVISNPKYRENVLRKAEVLKDRPASPLETAVYWIEYVIRHDGAPHLRSTVQQLQWYEKYLIDVLAVLAAVLLLALYVLKSVIKYIFQKLFKKSSKKIKKVKEEKKKN